MANDSTTGLYLLIEALNYIMSTIHIQKIHMQACQDKDAFFYFRDTCCT